MIAVDLFAGAGGFSTGAVAAGCTVAWAANHWPTAVEWHTANHPETVHACQDITFQRVDYRELEPAADREDREARLAFLAVRRAQIDELWGRP